MASSQEFHDFVLDQLAGLGELRSRRMFGEYGLYCDELFFAIIADEALWLKVDGGNRAAFEARGLRPFEPYGDGATMNYYEVPLDVLEDPSALRQWAAEALEAARRAPRRKRRSRR